MTPAPAGEPGMTRRSLSLVPDVLVPPPDRGRLMTAAQVVRELFPPGTSERFVQRHVSPSVPIGRRRFWYELDVKEWIYNRREATG